LPRSLVCTVSRWIVGIGVRNALFAGVLEHLVGLGRGVLEAAGGESARRRALG
jgi:hypothetical protein